MKKILIVDDAPQNIKVLNSILKGEYKTAAATSGKAALEVASQEPMPDLILLDVIMPEMDGIEVFKRLKDGEKTKDIPIIFVTSKNEIDTILDSNEYDGINYLTKPVDPDAVISMVDNFLK